MHIYVIKRLLLFPVTLLLVSVILFSILWVLPGDVARVILSADGENSYTEQEYLTLRHQLGLDRPLYVQYGSWLWSLVRLDLGTSLYYKTPVTEEVVQRLPYTFELAIFAWVFALVVGVTLGILMALRPNTRTDYALRVLAITGATMPAYWTGSLAIVILVLLFSWIPPLGAVPLWVDPWKNLQQVALPALVVGFFSAAIIARMTRSTMLEVLRQDYMRTAWAKGLPRRVGIGRHALKNALIPVVTISGHQFSHLMAGALVVELLFSIPGLGRALFSAVLVRDYPVVQAVVMLAALVVLATNLVVDVLYAWLDPRIHYNRGGST